MAGINEFMIFDENNQNSMTNETYSADEQRLNGVASGIARSSLYNKALRQATKMSKELGLFLSQKGNDVTIACNGAPIIGLVSTIYDTYGKPELYTKGILRKIETSASVQPNNYYMFSENKIMRIVNSDTYKEENATFSLIEIMS